MDWRTEKLQRLWTFIMPWIFLHKLFPSSFCYYNPLFEFYFIFMFLCCISIHLHVYIVLLFPSLFGTTIWCPPKLTFCKSFVNLQLKRGKKHLKLLLLLLLLSYDEYCWNLGPPCTSLPGAPQNLELPLYFPLKCSKVKVLSCIECIAQVQQNLQ